MLKLRWLKKDTKYIAMIYIAIILCTACSSSKLPNIPNIQSPQNIVISWVDDDLATSPKYQFVPAIDGNTIFTADGNGNIFRIDIADGTIINQYKIRRQLSSGTAVSSDSIFITTTTGYLLSISKANGKINWRTLLPTISVEAPQVSGNIVVVKTNDAELLAYDTNSGNLLWVYQRPIPTLTLRANNTFQIIDKDVLVSGQPGGRLVLLNLNNGNPIWENYVAIPEGATDLDKVTDIAMRPVLSLKEICVASFNGKISCVDAINSEVLWSKKFSSNYGLLADEQNIYAVDIDGVVYAFDKNTGISIWKNDILQRRQLSAPAFLNGNILIIDNDGFINLFDHNDGKLIARKASDLDSGVSLPWSDGKRVVAQSASGYIAQISQ